MSRPAFDPFDRPGAAAVRTMQVGLVAIATAGVVLGEPSVAVNALGGLLVTFVPAYLSRDLRLPMAADLTLWVTGAAFLHAVGALGVPGAPGNLYSGLWWWDHVTHATSASVVAVAGYGVVRALDDHDAVVLPGPIAFGVTLAIVLAVGVYWEILEYAAGHLSVFGESALTQYGADDTAADLAFDALGGLVVAAWSVRRLSPPLPDAVRSPERSG